MKIPRKPYLVAGWAPGCIFCHHIIWFWQRQGWLVLEKGDRMRWHAKCGRVHGWKVGG